MDTFRDALLTAIESTKYLYMLMCLLQAGFLILFICQYEDLESSKSVTATAKKTAKTFRYVTCSLCMASVICCLLIDAESAGDRAAEVLLNSIKVDVGMNLMEFACVLQEKRFAGIERKLRKEQK